MNKAAIFFILCCALVACSPAIIVKDINSIPPDEILVFGEIIATNVKNNSGYTIFILEEGTQKEVEWQMNGDKLVFWHLRPGRYIITSLNIMAGMTYGVGRIWVKFEVPSQYDSVYIGTLRLATGTVASIIIEDNMELAIAALNDKFSSPPLTMTKSLMKKEGQ